MTGSYNGNSSPTYRGGGILAESKMTITGYSRCQCGAVTVITDEGDYSCKARNLRKFFPNIDLRKLEQFPETFACNHCVNHYGLDLCGCGSGKPFGKCDNGFEACAVPMQVAGAYMRVPGGWAAGF